MFQYKKILCFILALGFTTPHVVFADEIAVSELEPAPAVEPEASVEDAATEVSRFRTNVQFTLESGRDLTRDVSAEGDGFTFSGRDRRIKGLSIGMNMEIYNDRGEMVHSESISLGELEPMLQAALPFLPAIPVDDF